MTELQWSKAYNSAHAAAQSNLGPISLRQTYIRIINTWVRCALTFGKAPDATPIYFAIFDSLPPEGFGSPTSIKGFIEQANRVQGLPALTREEGEQIDELAVLTFCACESMMTSKSKSSGCFSVIVFCILVAGLSALTARGIGY
jgi:hypothetical protein